MSNTIKCDECNGDLNVGDWPMCGGDASKHQPVQEWFHEGFEPYVDCQLLSPKDPRCTSENNLGIRGVPINSRSERRAYMKELGLQYGSQQFDRKRGRVRYVDQGSTRNKGF